MTGEPDPQWLREAARAFAHEWAEYFRTSWAVARAPRQFAADWADGRRQDINPVLFTLNMLAIQTPWVLLNNHLAGRTVDLPLWAQALAQTGEFLSILVCVLPLAGVVWLLGGRRPLRSTYAVTLYALAGPVTLVTLPLFPFFVRNVDPKKIGVATALLMMLAFVATMALWVGYVSLVISGLHRIRARGVALGGVAVAIAFGAFHHFLTQRYPNLAHALAAGG